MISSSYILDRRHHLQNGGSARPRSGTASALAGGPISQHRGEATDPGDQGSLQDGRRVHADMPYYVIGELTKHKCAYQPPQPIDWGSTDYEIVRLACAWFFEVFVLIRISHTHTDPAFGKPWVDYDTIPIYDANAFGDFCDRAGLNGQDLVKHGA